MDTFENKDEFSGEMEALNPQEFAPEQAAEPAPQAAPEAPVAEQSVYHGAGVGQRDFTGQEQPKPYQVYGQPDPYGQYEQGYYRQPLYQQPNYPPQYQQPYQRPPYQQPYYRQPGPGGYYPQPDASDIRTPPEKPQEKSRKRKEKKKGGFWKTCVAAILILALVGGSCFATAFYVDQKWQREVQQMETDFGQRLDALQKDVDTFSSSGTGNSISGTANTSTEGLTPAQVYAKNVASVVAISSTVTTQYYGQSSTGTSTGSGFILTENGYVVTNYHVVEGATSVTVTTNDGAEYTAAIVGGDDTNDVAVLKIEGNGLPAVTVGSSDDLIVGDQVAAIGNPLGELTNTLTVGYVSAKDRMVTTDGFAINMIQTDASINSGNSGGPLFNMKGEVVGITTAKYSGSSSSGATIEGIGFAIPIDDVYSLVEDLINYGHVTGAYLGVSVSDMDSEAAAYYGLPMGAYVREVTPGFAAEKAGIQVKDIIVAVGEYEVNGVSSLSRAMRNFKAGDTTTVTVYRSGVETVLTITLDAKPES